MPNRRLFSIPMAIHVVWPSILLLVFTGSVQGQTSPARFAFVVASGFVCDSRDSGNCPAVAKSENGDTYEIGGAGAFDQQNKSVKGAGTFTHKTANGTVLETGVWLASELISFDSYGVAPNAFRQRGPAFNPPQMGKKSPSISKGALPTGGLAIFRVLLITLSGTTKSGFLQVNCALGDVPQEHSTDGIRLSLEQAQSDYSEEVTGRAVFVVMKPESRAITKP